MLVVERVAGSIVEAVIFEGFIHKKTVFGVLPNTVRALLECCSLARKKFLPESGVLPNASFFKLRNSFPWGKKKGCPMIIHPSCEA